MCALHGMGHFRMKLDAEGGFSPLEGDGDALRIAAMTRQPSARWSTVSEWLIHTWRRGTCPGTGRAGFRQQGGGAVFPLVAGFYGAAVLDVQQLHAVAHAQDGDIQALEPFKVNVRASASVVLLGPPERMTAPGS